MQKSSFTLIKLLPLFLSLVLYGLIFWLRSVQGGWEIEINILQAQRESLDKLIVNLLPSPQAELLSGIILGNKKNLPAALHLSLRDTSTLHIVVVSGQNLSLLAGFFLLLSGLITKKLAVSLSFTAIIFYTLLTGAQLPVLRAAIMISFSFLAYLFGRQKDSVWVLITTAALMLLVNPAWISDLSFQLSFLATFGVVIVAPIILKYLGFLPRFIQDNLAVTLGAQIMVTPIIAQSFHQFSLVGVVANLLVLWTIPYIMILGTVTLILEIISTTLGQVVGIGVNVLLTYFIYIVQFFSSLPFAWIYVGGKAWIVWVGYYLLVAGVLMFVNKKTIEDGK